MNEIKENVINKNFMITYDFSDNDFASFSGKFYGKRSAERRKKKNDMN